MKNNKIDRRKFLKWNLATALGSSSLLQLFSGVHVAQAASINDEYKALVCVFLFGGNDSFNMIVPKSSSAYNQYSNIRQGIAINRNTLLAISPQTYNDGNAYGFHPSMPEVQQLFNQNKLSVIANVGTLAEPLNKAQYEAKTKKIPPQLFSHADQQDLWMKANTDTINPFGWAGRMTDFLYPNPSLAPKPAVNLTTWQANLWQSGIRHSMYEIPADGVEPLSFPWHAGEYPMEQAYRDIYELGTEDKHILLSHFADIQQRSDSLTETISDALKNAPSFTTSFPQNNQLSRQLEMVAKLIAIRNNLDSNISRQIYFVGLGGWDTHDNQSVQHSQKLEQLSKSLNAFNAALEEQGLSNQVTTFTASEFGRSMTPNNDGTDHGWGGHNLVMGGSVNGGDIFGRMPRLQQNSPDTVEDGRIIPTTSVEQYAATMANWFGLSSSEIRSVFPNLHRFQVKNLGFLS
jgi:uncharacterized protein (DUF1501 family)